MDIFSGFDQSLPLFGGLFFLDLIGFFSKEIFVFSGFDQIFLVFRDFFAGFDQIFAPNGDFF